MSIESPRLLWAISHQTLVSQDVLALRSGGFDVVAEEPSGPVFGYDRLGYWDDPGAPWRRADPELRSAIEVGRRARLWARRARVSAAEARVLNATFDVIAVASAFDQVTHLLEWFEGVVVFREFGNVPGFKPEGRLGDGHRLDPRVVVVPLYAALGRTPFAMSASAVHVVRSIAPRPPTSASATPGRPVVAVCGAYAQDLPWLLPLVADLVRACRGVEVRVVGLRPEEQGIVAGMGATAVPRLATAPYWQMFGEASVWVYPHHDPLHSHYIPFEAIALGIPCVLVQGGALVTDAGSRAGPLGTGPAVVPSVADVPGAVAALLADAGLRGRVSRAQEQLLAPYSPEAVAGQAAGLRRLVAERLSPRDTAGRAGAAAVGLPSPQPLWTASGGEWPTAVTVPAASIVDSVRIGSPPRLTLRGPGERLESVQVRPGPDAALVAGTVNWGRAPARFRVGVRAGLLAGGPAPDHDVPLVLVAQHLGGTTSTRTLHSGPADDGWRWVEQVVDGDSDLRVRLSAAAAAPTLVVHELRVERLGDAGTAAVAEDPVATGDLSARWDAGLPVPGFTLARSARTTEFTARLTRAWLAGLVVPLPTTRPLSAVVMAVGPRSGPVLVLRRRSARRLLAPVAVVGRRRRRVPMRPDDALYVLGRRRSVVGFSLAAAD